MKKLLVVKSFLQSSWGSCRVISPNLLAAYEKNQDFFNIEYFDVDDLFVDNEKSIQTLVTKIKNFRPSSLVFVDHLPQPSRILQALLEIMGPEELPEIVFHVYGDFTYFSKAWSTLNDHLIGHKIKFIVASEAQERLVGHFSNDMNCIERFMFPVNENEYYFDQKERDELREKLEIKEYEKVILYSGRISMQKNIDTLVKEFKAIVQNSKSPVHLWIVGAADDLGAKFMGVKNHDGFMYTKIQKIISMLPSEVSKMIMFWGWQPKDELRKIKAASDIFMSLSLYHDEDFGMSPAEALASGLPSLLTNWGGYYSFKSKKWNCKLIPVTLTSFGHKINTSSIHDFIKNYELTYINSNDRLRWSAEFLKEFSISAGAIKLRNILEKESRIFNGFNEKLIRFSDLVKTVKVGREISVELNPSDNNFYYEVYQNYIKPIEDLDDNEKQSSQFIQWGYDFVQNAYLNRNKNLSGHDNLYTHYLSPFAQEVYGPTNPLFIYGGHEIDEIKNKPRFTLRDGSIPLSIFFKEMGPMKATKEVLIHKDLWKIVPEKWQNKVRFFSVEASHTFNKDRLPKRIIVAGVINSMMATPEELGVQLKYLAESLGRDNLKDIEIYTFFPSKMTDFGSSWEEESVIKYSKVIFENLGMDIKFLNFKSIQEETNYSDCLYYEINNGLFLKDSYLQYLIFSRGGGSLKRPEPLEHKHFRKILEEGLSFNHKMFIYELDFSNVQNNLVEEYSPESAVSYSRERKFRVYWQKWCKNYLEKFQNNASSET